MKSTLLPSPVKQYSGASEPTQFFGLLASQYAEVTPFDQAEQQPRAVMDLHRKRTIQGKCVFVQNREASVFQ
jgi:hypothetical protein